MTSKEALSELSSFSCCNCEKHQCNNCIVKQIKKVINDDLVVLDILKRYIQYTPQRYDAFSLSFNDIELTQKETDLLKEWFENE